MFHWVYVVWVCFAVCPSTIMGAAFGRLHHIGAGAFGTRPNVVEYIMVDGQAANIPIQHIPNEGHLF